MTNHNTENTEFLFLSGLDTYPYIDYNQVRCHIEFNIGENGAERDRLTAFTVTDTVKKKSPRSWNFYNSQPSNSFYGVFVC